MFPPELCGSITHTDNYCAAAVTKVGRVVSIGIDAERLEELPSSLIDSILLPREVADIQGSGNAVLSPVLYFSMKESFYKAHHAINGDFLDFKDVYVSIIDETRFQVECASRAWDKRFAQYGRFSIDDEFVRSAVTIVIGN